ncbi:MAG: helix-turn-helix transcriptional regulator, partial [Eggerthellaceae bacterium]|nr:helix-turn-helix transcriptional regulator [Eggerthellaceae bacterium]
GGHMAYDREAVGRRLKSGIIDKGYSLEEFAEALGVSRQTLYEWFNGNTGMSFEYAVKACDLLDWPVDRLAVRETA